MKLQISRHIVRRLDSTTAIAAARPPDTLRKSLKIRRYRPHQMPEVPQICVFCPVNSRKAGKTGSHRIASATTYFIEYACHNLQFKIFVGRWLFTGSVSEANGFIPSAIRQASRGWYPYIPRRTRGYALAKKGDDPSGLQAYLGHTQIHPAHGAAAK